MSSKSVKIDQDQYEELQKIAERRGLKIIQVLRKALNRYINESKKG